MLLELPTLTGGSVVEQANVVALAWLGEAAFAAGWLATDDPTANNASVSPAERMNHRRRGAGPLGRSRVHVSWWSNLS